MIMSFTNPIFLWFLFSIPLFIIGHFFILRHLKRKAIKFANFDALKRVSGKRILTKNYWLLTIRAFILLLLIFSVAGATLWYKGKSSDFDYVLAIDVSSSMRADDIPPSRIDAAKDTAMVFLNSISSRTQVGIVSFSGVSIIEKRLTSNLFDVKDAIQNIDISRIGGTDLGEALITATNLLLESNKARVVILLTDGQSTVGVPVERGIEYANENGVMVYTIGVGTEAGGRYLNISIVSKLDETSLIQIAESTSGKYFRAGDVTALENAYKEIATSRDKKLSVPLRFPLLLLALILIFLEWGLINTKYRTLP